MTFLALLMRPWILRVRAVGAIPRVLADDMSVMAKGGQHFHATTQAMTITQIYVRDIGGTVSGPKSYTFSSDTDTRRLLRAQTWIAIAACCTTTCCAATVGATCRTPTPVFAPPICRE